MDASGRQSPLTCDRFDLSFALIPVGNLVGELPNVLSHLRVKSAHSTEISSTASLAEVHTSHTSVSFFIAKYPLSKGQ